MPKPSIRNQPTTHASKAFDNFDQLPASALVRLPVVCALLACSAPTVWRGVRAGRLPEPIRLTPGVTAWRAGDLRSVISRNAQASKRSA